MKKYWRRALKNIIALTKVISELIPVPERAKCSSLGPASAKDTLGYSGMRRSPMETLLMTT